MKWLNTIPGAVPLALRVVVCWICWRAEIRDGRTTKVPLNASGPPRRVDITHPETGRAFDEAVRGLRRPGVDGLGLVLGDSGFTAVDVDHAFEPDGETLKRDAARIVAALNTYTERSPSGEGLRLFIKGAKPGPKCRRELADGVSVEVYDTARYVTVTGHHLPGTPAEVADDQVVLDAFYSRLFPTAPERDRPSSATSTALTDIEVLDLARGAANGTETAALLAGKTSAYDGDASRADLALVSRLAFYTQDPGQLDRIFRGSRLMRDKWDAARGSQTYGEITIDRALGGVEETYIPGARRPAADRAAKPHARLSAGPFGVCLADVVAEPVRWAWPGWLALGKLHVFDGDPGVGKSTLMAYLAACVTAGVPWPDGRHVPSAARGGVVIVTAEDDSATTIQPRMAAAGADLGLVTVVSTLTAADGTGRLPVFPGDTDYVVAECQKLGARLLVIDPVTAYLGDVNSYRDSDVRGALAPLAAAAEEAGIAVVLIRHLNKTTGGSALYRGGGSIAFVGLARVAWVAGHDPNNPAARAIAVSKNNIAAFPPALGYDLVSAGPFDVGKAVWLGPVPLTANDLVSPPPPRATAVDEAAGFLESALAGGPRPATIVTASAKEAGIAEKTLRRAKDEIGVQSVRKGGVAGKGSWDWKRPDEQPDVDVTSIPATFRDDRDAE